MGTGWRYDWLSNGMLRRVVRPDEKTVYFRYDALGRRTAKVFWGMVTRWIWGGNVPLHEWEYKAKVLQVPLVEGDKQQPPVELTEDVTTWVFKAGTFVPAAKIKGDKRYSIVTDYLGTPIQMYDEQGEKTWDCTLDVYGKVANFEGSSLKECPFRYQGQYEDEETGLYYNRFRYYNPNGSYISTDPVGLRGGLLAYSYAYDTNGWIDIWGLAPWGVGSEAFNKWWETASEADIKNSIKSVKAHLRGSGGMHEMFPVAAAAEAKRLGFTAEELKDMVISTKDLKFKNVGLERVRGVHHSSSASKLFHDDLINQLKGATTKEQAMSIIKNMHNTHVVDYASKKPKLKNH